MSSVPCPAVSLGLVLLSLAMVRTLGSNGALAHPHSNTPPPLIAPAPLAACFKPGERGLSCARLAAPALLCYASNHPPNPRLNFQRTLQRQTFRAQMLISYLPFSLSAHGPQQRGRKRRESLRGEQEQPNQDGAEPPVSPHLIPCDTCRIAPDVPEVPS